MQKICLIVFFTFLSAMSFAQTGGKPISEYKQDSTILVKDSAGLVLAPSEWFEQVKSGLYTIEAKAFENDVPVEFLFRKSTAEEIKALSPPPVKRPPMTLAGFTTYQPMGKFSVTDIQGKVHSNETIKGKIAVIVFWYKDANACKEQAPDLNRLVDKYKNKGVEFLAVTYDPAQDVLDFIAKNPFRFAIAADVEDMIIDLKISKYPTHVVVDKEGIVQFVNIGHTGDAFEMLEKEIKLIQQQ